MIIIWFDNYVHAYLKNKLDNYSTWIQLGMTLKNIRAPLEVWEELNMKSKKFKNSDCKNRWFKFKESKYMAGTLKYLAKESNLDMYNKTKSEQHALNDVLDDENEKDIIDIDPPFLKLKTKKTR